MRLLALLGSLGAGAGRFGLRFLLGGVLLGVGLVLLSLALADQVVTACYGADRFLGLALDVLDDALMPSSGPVFFFSVMLTFRCWLGRSLPTS